MSNNAAAGAAAHSEEQRGGRSEREHKAAVAAPCTGATTACKEETVDDHVTNLKAESKGKLDTTANMHST